MARKFVALMECFSLDEAVQFDDANGVIKGASMLTGMKESGNKTFYTEKALAEAQTRYEGAKMFIDHPAPDKRNQNRSVMDFGGVFKNVRLDGAKVRGDLHLVESKRSSLMAISKMKPDGIGFSIKDRGYGTEKNGVLFVEGFDPRATFSVDMVCDPSTNKDLFEAIEKTEEEEIMDFKSLTVETLSKECPALVESIQNAGKAAILKELEEAKTNEQKSGSVAAKLLALIEADFSKEISEAVKKMVMPDGVTIDMAKAIITGQKELVEAMGKKVATTTGKPVVKGLGQHKEEDLEEGKKGDLPTDDDILSAFGRR